MPHGPGFYLLVILGWLVLNAFAPLCLVVFVVVHLTFGQVCALFNARANVGEARFVCPLCRLRSVKTSRPGPAAIAEVFFP